MIPCIKNFSFVSLHRNIDFGDLLTPEIRAIHPYTTYDLIANIVHDGDSSGTDKGTYRVHTLHKVRYLLTCYYLLSHANNW